MITAIATLFRHGRLGLAPVTTRAVALVAASLVMLGLAAPALGSAARESPAIRQSELREVFVVASDEAAAAHERLLSEANLVRGWAGEPPLPFEVAVVRSAEERREFVAKLDEANQVRAGLSLPPIVLIQLRR